MLRQNGENLKSDEGKSYTEKGISIDKERQQSQRCSSKVITSGGDNGTTRIMSDDGNAVKYEGRSNMKAHKML
jgi:hypothetical protein